MLNCQVCGTEDTKSVYWIRGKRHCDACAATRFQQLWFKCRTRLTNANKRIKQLLNDTV